MNEHLVTMLAMFAVLISAAAMLSTAVTGGIFKGFKCSWPLVLSVAVYLLAWFWEPPKPLSAFMEHTGMVPGELLRYMALAYAMYWLQRDYKHEILTGKKHLARAEEAEARLRQAGLL